MFKFTANRPSRTPRRGAVAIWGLACLILASAVVAMLGKLAVTGSRIVIQDHRHIQCEWLVQSGWSLAKSRLEDSPDYKGETWDITADGFSGSDVGQVTIDVAAPEKLTENAEYHVQIRARYPKDATQQIRITTSRIWKSKL